MVFRVLAVAILILEASSFATASTDEIFVANSYGACIGKYTTSGSTLNASLISGLSFPSGTLLTTLIYDLYQPAAVALDGHGHLYVASWNGANSFGAVGEYTLTGAPINPSLISGLSSPSGLAFDSSGNLFVSISPFGSA